MNAIHPVVWPAVWAAFALWAPGATGGNPTVPGTAAAPCPTIHNLAVEWKIEGDENLNGTVTVRFREAGKDEWRAAMPLRRVPAGGALPHYGPRPKGAEEDPAAGQ